MIEKLRKNVSILFVLLLTVIFIFLLIDIFMNAYNDKKAEFKQNIRTEIKESGWREFLSGEDTGTLEDMEYCVLKYSKNNEPSIITNQFHNKTEKQLLKYGKHISNKHESTEYTDIIYLTKSLYNKSAKTVDIYIVLVSINPVRKAAIPGFILCIILGIIGILGLIWAAGRLSRWLIRPIENMLENEKLFISNAGHELKTPITIIKTNVELLQDEIGKNKALDYIGHEAERMAHLVNQMLELTHLETMDAKQTHKKFSADEAILGILYPMESLTYEKDIGLTFDIEENMSVTGNEEQIKSLVSILMDNAISYTDPKGHIKVRAYIAGRKFYLIVANSGEPIPKEQQLLLFKRFYRRDEARSANDTEHHFGLGLSIANCIAENHNGTIYVESEDGENKFTVEIPV